MLPSGAHGRLGGDGRANVHTTYPTRGVHAGGPEHPGTKNTAGNATRVFSFRRTTSRRQNHLRKMICPLGFREPSKNTSDSPVSRGTGDRRLWTQMGTLARPRLDNQLHRQANIPLGVIQPWDSSPPLPFFLHKHIQRGRQRQRDSPSGTNFKSPPTPHSFSYIAHSFRYSSAGNGHSFVPAFFTPDAFSDTSSPLLLLAFDSLTSNSHLSVPATVLHMSWGP